MESGEVITAYFRDRRVLLVIVACLLCQVRCFSNRVSAEQPSDDLAGIIDRQLEKTWAAEPTQPVARASGQVLLRRVTMDLAGRVPLESEAREYLADARSDKYRRLVDRLLSSPEFEHHMAIQLRRVWLPQLETQPYQHLITGYQHWLRSQLAQGTSYDRLVRMQLNSPVGDRNIAVHPLDDDLGSPVFLAAAEFEPARIAANSARAFLGLNIDCAQCHDHPFSRWSQTDFWKTAAFFSRNNCSADGTSWCIQIEGSQQTVSAAFLDNEPAPSKPTQGDHFQLGREAFSTWATGPANPYFAANGVNRLWGLLLGSPLATPVDDLTEAGNGPHGATLQRLSEHFVASGYALKPLVRAIVLSRAYQLSSTPKDEPNLGESAKQLFSVRSPRLLTSSQLVNSIRVASGLVMLDPDNVQQTDFASEFIIEDPINTPRSTVQALMMMNGELVEQACDPAESPLILALATAPYLNNDEKIDAMFLRTLTRCPSSEEREEVNRFVEQQVSSGTEPGHVYADLFWTLLNTAEFHAIQ